MYIFSILSFLTCQFISSYNGIPYILVVPFFFCTFCYNCFISKIIQWLYISSYFTILRYFYIFLKFWFISFLGITRFNVCYVFRHWVRHFCLIFIYFFCIDIFTVPIIKNLLQGHFQLKVDSYQYQIRKQNHTFFRGSQVKYYNLLSYNHFVH